MKIQLKQILSYIMLSFFLMTNMGFALIHHSCNSCEVDTKEIQFFVLNHSHQEEENCFVKECCIDDEHAHNCTDSHTDECQVEVNRLTTPYIISKGNAPQIPQFEYLANNHSFQLSLLKEQFHYTLEQFTSTPNLKTVWGVDLLIVHSVFRL